MGSNGQGHHNTSVLGAGDRSWMRRAKCVGMDDEMFFPERGAATLLTQQAKAVCAACPVQLACLEYALNEDFGIWGGTSGRERKRLRRRRQAGRAA